MRVRGALDESPADMSRDEAWRIEPAPLEGHPGLVLETRIGERVAARGEFYRALRDQRSARRHLVEAFLSTGLSAFAWETAPVSRATLERPMVQVVLPHPALARAQADPRPFAEHIASGAGTEGVRWFANFAGDARLVVPCAPRPNSPFAHLAQFLRHASERQIDALFELVGTLVCEHARESDQPLWVSTAGMAVAWVHVRLDSRPKYYRSETLRRADA